MRHIVPVLILVSMLLGGCVSTNVTPLSNKAYDPVNPNDVVLYLDEADIPNDYEKVAVIYAEGDHYWTDESEMFKQVRKKAANLGANGILVERVKEPGTGAKVAQALIGTEANRRAEAVAIYVLPNPKTPPTGTPRL